MVNARRNAAKPAALSPALCSAKPFIVSSAKLRGADCNSRSHSAIASAKRPPRIISRIDARSPHKGTASKRTLSSRKLESNPRSDLNHPGTGIAVLAENTAEVRIARVRINSGEIHSIDDVKKLKLQL